MLKWQEQASTAGWISAEQAEKLRKTAETFKELARARGIESVVLEFGGDLDEARADVQKAICSLRMLGLEAA